MSRDLYLPQDRYVAALERIRGQIEGGLALDLEDSNAIGDKYTHSTWGLCSGDAISWPDAEDHLWPDQFLKYGRVAPKYRQTGQMCPMDRRAQDPMPLRKGAVDNGPWGCFYHCRLFQPKLQKGASWKDRPPKLVEDDAAAKTKEGALALYDEQLKRVRLRVTR